MSAGATEPASASVARAHGIQVFSAPSDAPRVRRVGDLAAVVIAAGLLLVLALVAADGTAFDDRWSAMVGDLPGWVLWASQAAYVLTVAYAALLLIGVTFIARHRLELARDLLLAAALSGGIVVGLSQVVDSRWPELALVSSDHPTTTFPTFFVAATVAIQAAAGPHLSAPFRRFGWGLVLGGASAALVGNVSLPSDVAAAVLVGLIAAAVIRFALGTSAGLPSTNRVRGGVREIGVDVVDLSYMVTQPVGSALLTGPTATGTPVLVRVLGRDAWEARRWTQLWRAAWYQDDGPQVGHSRREQVEHEALALLLAGRAGASVSDLLGVGLSSQEDAIIAVRREEQVLADLDGTQIDDDLLQSVWQQAAILRDAGVSHGQLNAANVWIDGAGTPVLRNFVSASMNATEQQLDEDLVELLVSTALLVGTDRAIAAARGATPDADLVAALPVLEPAALSPTLRRMARHQKLKLGDLRTQLATALGVDPPPVEQLKRVDPRKVIGVALGVFAVYTIISGLADVGLSTITDALGKADWATLILALILVQSTNATDAMSLVAISPKPVPVGVATTEQLAISFVQVAVPSDAGRIAVNIRFFQRFGISPVASTSSSMVASFIALLAKIILLILAIVVFKQSVDLSKLQLGGVLDLLGVVAAIVVIGLIIVAATPKLRHGLATRLAKPLQQLRDAMVTVKQPRNFLRALGASIGTEVLYASGIVLSVQALGGSVNLGQAIFINITVSLFAGLTPVPGGVGVQEAGLTAGLVGVGVASSIAVPAVLLYRMMSYYLPPIWGFLCMKWLARHDYL